jgi:hypothetical protein
MLVELNNTHQSSGLQKVCDFAIETNGVMIKALTSRLYSNPIASIVRELASNALDACRTTPMTVKVPTQLDPSFSIRDHGPGLSPQQMADVFTRFGASTKRSDNSQIGGFGLGAKSPFALVNSYTIISYHEGTRTTYIASITSNGMPALHSVSSTPTTETGLEIIVPATPTPHWVDALSQIKFFHPRPIIKGCDFEFPKIIHDHPEYLVLSGGKPSILVGPVAYPLNTSHFQRVPPFALKFPIGSIEVTASREEIVYSAATISNIKDRLDPALVHYKGVVDHLLTQCRTIHEVWHLLEGNVFNGDRIFLAKGITYKVSSRYAAIPSSPNVRQVSGRRRKTWRISPLGSSTLYIHPEDVVYLDDDTRKVKERIEAHLRTLPNVTGGTDIYLVKDRTHFDNLGIPIYPISTLPYTGTLRASPKPRTFRIIGTSGKLARDPNPTIPFTHYIKVNENLEWRGVQITSNLYNLMQARSAAKLAVVPPSYRGSLDHLQDFGPHYDAVVDAFWKDLASSVKDFTAYQGSLDYYRRPLYAALAELKLVPFVADRSSLPSHLTDWQDISLLRKNLPPLPPSPNYKQEFTNVLNDHPHLHLLNKCTSWTSRDVPALTSLIRTLIKE